MTYTEFVAAIQTYTQNNFPTITLADSSTVTSTQQINRFIEQAELRIYNSVQFPSLRKNVLGSTTASNKYVSCPDDFLSTYSVAVVDADGNYEYLLNKDVNFIRQAYPNTGAAYNGFPKYYALFGPTVATITGISNELSLILGPTPDAAYSVELHYYYYPESITTASSGRTWLGDNFDIVLLYGALVEAYTFMKGEPDLVQLYDTKYNEALGMAKRLGDGLERSDAYRSGQYRVAPLPQNNGVR
jgi:hypothetical protein